MADCKIIKEFMMLQMDDSLSAENKIIFDEHIASCESCKQEFDSLVSMLSELNALEEIELPQHFHIETMEKIKQSNSKPFHINKSFRWRQYANVAAVFLLTVMLVSSATVGVSQLFSYKNSKITTDEFAEAQNFAGMMDVSENSDVMTGTAETSPSPTVAAPMAMSEPTAVPAMGKEVELQANTAETGEVNSTLTIPEPIAMNEPTEMYTADAGTAEADLAMSPVAMNAPMAETAGASPRSAMDVSPMSASADEEKEQENRDAMDPVAMDFDALQKSSPDDAVPMTMKYAEPSAPALRQSLPSDDGVTERNVKSYDITIVVDDLNIALQSIDTRYTTNSEINQFDKNNSYANITQVVDDIQFDSTISALKSLGEVTDENQGQRSVLMASKDAYSHYIVKFEEQNRLTELLAKPGSIEDMLTVRNRLNAVINELEDYKTQINNYNAMASSPTIQIRLVERYKPEKEPAEKSAFGAKVKDTFFQSINAVVFVSEGTIYLMAYLLAPALLVGLCVFVVILVRKRLRR